MGLIQSNIQQYKQRLFFGDPMLRRMGDKYPMSKEQMKMYLRCADDPIYFIDNFIKIITIDEGLVQIKMWKFQKKLVKVCHENNRVVLKAGRQTGKTTILAVGYLLWYAIFQHDKIIGILAQKEKTAKEILSRIKTAYRYLPKWIQQGVVEWNKESISLENGSMILSESTSSGAIRGFTLALLYLDEFAFVPNNIAHDFLTSVYPTISSGKTAKIFVSSTPNGMNHFYKMVMDAKRDEKNNVKNAFKLVENTWRDRPDRDQAWVDDQKRTLGEEKFMQEHECEFLGSKGSLISSTALKNMVYMDAIQELLENKLKVYEKPIAGTPYVMCVDTSHGKELDASAFVLFDVSKTPYKIVATYKHNGISPQEYPNIIKTIAAHYNRAYILVENNDVGAMVLNILMEDLEYEYVFQTIDEKTNQNLTFQGGKTPGIRTTKKTKRQGCALLKTMIESSQLDIPDFDIISELTTFIIHSNGVYSADTGATDDLVMCLVLFAWLTQQQIFKDLTDIDLRKKLFDNRSKDLEDQMPPLPVHIIADPGPDRIRTSECIWTVVPNDKDLIDEKWSGFPGPEGYWVKW